jgi:drug/metabolite transporter (DMT)-like permease
MPSTSIACGTLLVLIGILGYINGVMTNHASVTALIPAFFGIVLILLGVFARMREGLRKHLMHAAVIVALLGFLATAGRLVSKMSELTYSAAVVSQVSMALVCLLFVILAVKSFIDARRNDEPA